MSSISLLFYHGHFITGVSRGSVTEIVESLLARCVIEENPNARILIGSCFGEIGAISAHRLEDLNPVDSSVEALHRYAKPPWLSDRTQYELSLLTNQLPVAIKAAATALDQNLIGFTIQEIFSIIEIPQQEGNMVSDKARRRHQTVKSEKQPMSRWLVQNLQAANVLDIVEPFWCTEFLVSCRCYSVAYKHSLSLLTDCFERTKNHSPKPLPFSQRHLLFMLGCLLGAGTWFTDPTNEERLNGVTFSMLVVVHYEPKLAWV
jgi:hypothetical protein